MSTFEMPSSFADDSGFPVLPVGRMTEEEFLAWYPDDVRAEWVDGEVIMMSPSSTDTDDLNGWFLAILRSFARRKNLGRVLGPNSMVRLATQRRRRIPDILFVQNSRLDIIRTNHLEGAPDLAVEIVSPESFARDWREKYQEYETAGVQEYWVIDPQSEHAELYVLGDDRKYQRQTEQDGYLKSMLLPGFNLRTIWFWTAPRPDELDVLRELGVI